MRDLSVFLKPNQKKVENIKFAATNLFTDEKGKSIEWEFRHLSPKEESEIRDICYIEKPKIGRKGKVEVKFDNDKYGLLIICESCVWPELNNAGLQDSYGVKEPEELIQKMVPIIGDWMKLQKFIFEYQGLNVNIEDDIEEAKN